MLPTNLFAAIVAFPTYEDPVAIGPAVLRPAGARACRVSLFANEALKDYGQVAMAAYQPPTSCSPATAAAIVLEFEGAVAGVQFDRAGALWLGGVELLRTTTPEPDAAGIRWSVARDLTEYALLFEAPATATLQIPNLVDSTYTGILYINASLVFYDAGQDDGSQVEAPVSAPPFRSPSWSAKSRDDEIMISPPAGRTAVVALADPTQATSPWDAMGLAGNQSRVATVRLPRRNVRAARIDLYASGHACEEFWYTNVLDNYTNATGACGGGAYRELQLRVDGLLAGALPPFPVIYTGGVCPLLWRPLTGLYSFNIPPYQLDLAPFLGLLNDGKPHTLEVTVFGNGPKGSWFVDPVLLAVGAAEAAVPLTGTPPRVRATPPDVRVTVTKQASQSWRFVTTAGSSWEAEGELAAADGSFHTRATARGGLRATNDNRLNASGGVAVGGMTSTIKRVVAPAEGGDGGAATWASEIEYPYSIGSAEAQAATSFQLVGDVTYGLDRTEAWSGGGAAAVGSTLPPWWPRGEAAAGDGQQLAWSARAQAHAVYNRSTGADRTPHVEIGEGVQSFVSPQACVTREAASKGGNVTKRAATDGCKEKPARTELCRTFDECAPPTTASRSRRPVAVAPREGKWPVRRPWRDAPAMLL